ncbi:MAG: 1-acyl-sn-glycerol-3-phosphate acyltransferase [Lachnospiraceae bacterium]|nr:1-acyl-sn-glycerol-3-phosphate acyltransferase [Lachnospiraceae bacterium]
MRSIFIVLFLVVYLIISLPLYLVAFLLGKFDKRKQFAFSQKAAAVGLGCIRLIAGTRRTVKGLENIPRDEPVLFISNHRGFFDVILAYTTLPVLTSFVSKKEIRKIPCVGTWMRFLRCLFLDRKDVRADMKEILKGIEQIKEGYSIFIMPEGTRGYEDEPKEFHEGSFKFAQKTGCPIVPVAITNTEAVFEKQFPWVKKAYTSITYGKPFYVKDLDAEQKKHVGEYTRSIIIDMLKENEMKN